MRVDTDLIDVVSNVRDGEPTVAPSLVASVLAYGLIQPIVVLDTGDGRYRILDGHRRFAAVQEAGFSEVAITTRESDLGDGEIIGAQVNANTQREDMTEWQLAQAVIDLKDIGSTVKDTGVLLGMTQKEVSAYRKAGASDITDEQGNQMGIDGLVDLAEAVKQTGLNAGDLAARIVSGDSRDMYAAVRDVEWEVEEVKILEELVELQAVWAKDGTVVHMSNPSLTGKTDKYGYAIKNKNVLPLIDNDWGSGVKLSEAKHRKEPCHAVVVSEGRGFGHTSVASWCLDVRRHKSKGESKLQAENVKTSGTAMSDNEKADRRAAREAKVVRQKQAAQWLKRLPSKEDQRIGATFHGLQQWKGDHTRMIVMSLIAAGEIEARPKGSEYDWYSNQLEDYLTAKFGEYSDKRDAWMVKALDAFDFIEHRPHWTHRDAAWEQMAAIEVTSE